MAIRDRPRFAVAPNIRMRDCPSHALADSLQESPVLSSFLPLGRVDASRLGLWSSKLDANDCDHVLDFLESPARSLHIRCGHLPLVARSSDRQFPPTYSPLRLRRKKCSYHLVPNYFSCHKELSLKLAASRVLTY
ncbi:unnamed protein product [Dibothriocephalus latus]|uniref:Uncharacterized protein n=1 Tax=Dibothriocephalus latus TaxID=60516 RepID=A0A3P7LJL5_DIBLA|nr:unnamed protein product [Dibothriocephalus latus]